MSVFQFKKKRFQQAESSDSSDEDEVDDDKFDASMEEVLAEAEEEKNSKGKGKKGGGKLKAPAPKRPRPYGLDRAAESESDAEVEACAPVINIDESDEDEEDDRSDEDVDVEVDEATKRRLKMLRESRAAREALRRAEQEVEILDSESEEEAAVATAPPVRSRRGGDATEASVASAAPPPPTFRGKKLKVFIRTKDDKGKPVEHSIYEDEPFSALFERYACDRGVDSYDCKFMFDGENLGGGAKPQAVDMEDDDMIDCVAPPKGKKRPRPGEGGSTAGAASPAKAKAPAAAAAPAKAKKSPPPKAKKSPPPKAKASPGKSPPEAAPKAPREKVLLAFTVGGAKPKKFKVHNDDTFHKAFTVYKEKISTHKGAHAFSYDGTPVRDEQTPADLGISGSATIDVAYL